MFCPHCGKEIDNGSAFCAECGEEIIAQQIAKPATPQPLLYTPIQNQAPPPAYQVPAGAKPKKKRHVGLYVLLCILILLAGIIAYMLGSLFFFPPKDLGVKYTPADYASVVKKIGINKDKAPTTGSLGDYKYVYSGTKYLDALFTQEELTAWLNEGRPSYFALKKTQVKINKDGTVEASGEVNFDVAKYIVSKNIAGVDWKQVPIPIPSKANAYVKSGGSVTNNLPNLVGLSGSIGAIPMPSSALNKSNVNMIDNDIKTIIENGLPGVKIDKIEVIGNKIHFAGQIPAKMERVKNK
jgi:hypothetical protein